MNAETINISNSVKSINQASFEGNKLSHVELPDSVTTISSHAFSGNKLSEIIIPDSINNIFNCAFGYPSQTNNLSIVCKGTNCDKISQILENYTYGSGTNINANDLSGNIALADANNCNSQKYYWTGEFCNNRPKNGDIECSDGYFANNEDNCEIIRTIYTMEEADKATSNDNENLIEWIFM